MLMALSRATAMKSIELCALTTSTAACSETVASFPGASAGQVGMRDRVVGVEDRTLAVPDLFDSTVAVVVGVVGAVWAVDPVDDALGALLDHRQSSVSIVNCQRRLIQDGLKLLYESSRDTFAGTRRPIGHKMPHVGHAAGWYLVLKRKDAGGRWVFVRHGLDRYFDLVIVSDEVSRPSRR